MKGKHITFINGTLALAVTVMLTFASPCLAKEHVESEEGLEVEAKVSAMLGADVEDSEGEVGVIKVDTSVSYSWFNFEYGLRSYWWDNVDKLPFGNRSDDPWNELHKLGFGADKRWQVNKKWSYFLRGGVSSSFEEEMKDSFEYDIVGAAMYALSPLWQFNLGARLSYDEVDEFKVFPIGGIYWNQMAETGWSTAIGVPETNLKYKFSPEISSKLAFSFDKGLYRLADDSTVENKGYLKNDGLVLGLCLDMVPFENSLLSIGTHVQFCKKIYPLR